MNTIRWFAFICLFVPSMASAKVFSNSYISFELPPRWECEVQKTEWVCRSEADGSKKEAAIILTAKEVGSSDNMTQYESYLKTPKQILDPAGKTMMSTIKLVKQIQIAGQPWMDGMHLQSEVPFYYTRYLATVKQKIAILVTFSAHQTHYTKYSQDFFRAIQSLRVVASSNLLNLAGGNMGGGSQMLGAPVGVPANFGGDDAPAEPIGASKTKQNALLLSVLLVAVGGYFILKKKKKKPKKPNPFG